MAQQEMLGIAWWTLGVCAAVVYIVGGAVYRLYLSPLSKFPGRRMAALTLWYEFYYDVIRTGKYMWEIEKMHAQYGPIVRINPYELHINDPDFYDEIYARAGRKCNKYAWFVRLFGMADGALATVDHDLHRVRRAAINPFFSKANVRKLEKIIQEKSRRVLEYMTALEDTGQALKLTSLCGAFTSDVIVEYAFGESHNYLGHADLNAGFFDMMGSIHHLGNAAKQFGWLLPLLLSIPERITSRLDPGMAAFAAMQKTCRDQVRHVMEHMDHHESKTVPTIFHDILRSNLLPSEKRLDRLCQEGQTFIAAGTETTAWCLTVITFHLLQDPRKLERLRRELLAAKATSTTDLEKLPYLEAVIQEGLRLSFGVSTRLPRISPEAPIRFLDGEKVWVIPAGTPVSMSAGLLHLNPTTFPSPHEFQPERWINNKKLGRYLVSFSRGSRQCAGINLAYSELYITLNTVFSRYGAPGQESAAKMALFETAERDVEMRHDLFIPWPAEDSKGVRVVFSRS